MLRRPRPRPRGLSSPRVARPTNSLRPAQRQCFIIAKNLKICRFFAKAPSHEKHFAPLDVRGLWHARPLPYILPFTSNGLRPRKKTPAAQHKKLNEFISFQFSLDNHLLLLSIPFSSFQFFVIKIFLGLSIIDEIFYDTISNDFINFFQTFIGCFHFFYRRQIPYI